MPLSEAKVHFIRAADRALTENRKYALGNKPTYSGSDLVEVSLRFDHAEVAAIAGASLLFDMVCVVAENRA